MIGWQSSRHFLNQWEALPVFPRLAQLHVFALNSDWFIVLLTSVAIGQSNYFCFELKTAVEATVKNQMRERQLTIPNNIFNLPVKAFIHINTVV